MTPDERQKFDELADLIENLIYVHNHLHSEIKRRNELIDELIEDNKHRNKLLDDLLRPGSDDDWWKRGEEPPV